MTAREIASEALLRGRRRLTRTVSRATDDPKQTYVSDEGLRRALNGLVVSDVAARIRRGADQHLTPGLADPARTARTITELFPGSIEESRREADAILAHKITVFGRVHDLGREIDWRRDPDSGVRWPFEHYSRTPIVIGQGADIRVVWELNRLQHFTALGRAYMLTGDERYTEEFLIELASWYEENPPRFGANWRVAMEVAIRAINIIAALEMFRGSLQMSDEAIGLILKTLLAHGRFIRKNLEFNYRSAGNHYLSDLIGLFAIGMMIPELGESRSWVSFSTERLLEEMDRQVLPDGVDYEGSTGYHRFVLEIFALFFSISRSSGVEILRRYWERLEAMFDFVRRYLKPDGTAPAIGDSDDGRLIRFKSRPADDHSYLMSIASVLFESNRFKQARHIDEEAIWWFGDEGCKTYDRLALNESPLTSQAFPEAQIFIQRGMNRENSSPLYAIIDCGDHGARGHGSHAHSDALSFEVFAFNRTFIRDPGTFVYTGSEEWRNRFRSTAYHNTVRIDGEEISQTNAGDLFAFKSNVRPRVNRWESTAKRDVLDAEHYAYRRLAEPVTHRRIVTLDKLEGYWIIEDIFTGKGIHRFEFFFNFDAGLEVEMDTNNRATARGEDASLTIMPASDHTLEAQIESRWASPAYGTRQNSSAIIYTLLAEAPLKVSFHLLPSRQRTTSDF